MTKTENLSLPSVLIIDDLLGWSLEDRRRFCRQAGIIDVTSHMYSASSKIDGAAGAISHPVAVGTFTSGQRITSGRVANDPNISLEAIASGWREDLSSRWALVLLDLEFDEGPLSGESPHPDLDWPAEADKSFGLKVLEAIGGRWPGDSHGKSEIPVIILTSQAKIERGRQAGRLGAEEYVEKDRIDREILEELLFRYGLLQDDPEYLFGSDPEFLRTLRKARLIARESSGNVLILGERGSGKSAMADYIRRHSSRTIYQSLTLGADQSLFKSGLFGHWVGAFTDARKSEAGAAEQAHKGILFLDEIANLPPEGQTELLQFCRPDRSFDIPGGGRVEGLRRIRRLGHASKADSSVLGMFESETQTILVDVFLIAATNQPIDNPTYCEQKGFMPDLFDRLAVEDGQCLRFPSLRERKGDIVPLFERFVREATEERGGYWPKEISGEVRQYVSEQKWLGNIVELRGFAREAAIASLPWDEILIHQLPVKPALKRNLTLARPLSVPELQVLDLKTLVTSMRQVRIQHTRRELDGALETLEKEYARLIIDLLAAALEETRENRHSSNRDAELGDLSPTKAIKLLTGKRCSTTEAADQINRITRRYREFIASDSLVSAAAKWAERRRRGK